MASATIILNFCLLSKGGIEAANTSAELLAASVCSIIYSQ